MKKERLMIQSMARNVDVVYEDLRDEFSMNSLAEREISSLERKVSPQLYGMLVQQLLAFHGDMQLIMAENLVIFAYEQIAHTTGCPSVDVILDICYAWIAAEKGFLKPGYRFSNTCKR